VLVDSDRSGKAGEARYPEDSNDMGTIGWAEGGARGGIVTDEHDEFMLGLRRYSLCRSEHVIETPNTLPLIILKDIVTLKMHALLCFSKTRNTPYSVPRTHSHPEASL